MEEINFIQQDGKEKKKKKEKEESRNVEWTTPEKDEVNFIKQDKKKSSFSSFLNFFSQTVKPDKAGLRIKDKIADTDNAAAKPYAKKVEKQTAEIKVTEPAQSVKHIPLPPVRPKKAGWLSGLFGKKEPESPWSGINMDKDGKEIEFGMIEEGLRSEKQRSSKKKNAKKPPDLYSMNVSEEEIENSGALQTNLIKEKFFEFYDWKKKTAPLTLSLIISVLLLVSGFLMILVWEKIDVGKHTFNQEEVASLNTQISQAVEDVKDKNLSLEEKKVPVILKLLDNHIYWTNYFKFLEENTLESVFYLAFSGDLGGSYVLSARTGDLKSVAEQIRLFKSNEKVVSADTNAVGIGSETLVSRLSAEGDKKETIGSGNISFNLKLQINPQLFKEFNK